MLGEGPIYDVNGGFGAAEKKFSINFTKANTKFCLSLYYYNQIYITIMRLYITIMRSIRDLQV